MTLRRTHLVAISTALFAVTGAGCGGNGSEDPETSPTVIVTPTVNTPSPSPSPTATAPTATPTASPNAPLDCPDALTVAGATDSALLEQTVDSPMMCAYGVPSKNRSGSIQSEDWFGAKTLKGYRATLRKANGTIAGIKTKVELRPEFGTGAFMVTITGKVSGPITNLVVPRPGGQFASISASRVRDGIFSTDLKLTEQLAHAFLDN